MPDTFIILFGCAAFAMAGTILASVVIRARKGGTVR